MKSPRRQRLDTLLVEKGLVESREKARALILAGQVDVDGHGAAKAGTMIPIYADIRVIGPDHPWVSRGGVKLAAALDQYGTEIGLAFQIVDDILDEEGSSASLGKTAGKDKAAGKPTYPAFFGLERSRELAAECRANARVALERAGLLDSRLADIASWIIDRKT